MFALTTGAAALLFLSHVTLLLASFSKGKFHRNRYFWSHATLWITGVLVFLLAVVYAGSGKSTFIDYFDTTVRKAMILIITALLSLTAHTIVSRFVLKYR